MYLLKMVANYFLQLKSPKFSDIYLTINYNTCVVLSVTNDVQFARANSFGNLSNNQKMKRKILNVQLGTSILDKLFFPITQKDQKKNLLRSTKTFE